MSLVFTKWMPVVAAVVVVAFIFAGIAELSDDVMEGDTQASDAWAIRILRHEGDPAMPRGPLWIRQAMVDVTALGSHAVLVFVSLAAAGFCLFIRRFDSFYLLLTVVVGAMTLNAGLKAVFARERPAVVEPLVEVSTYSYPSGHALMSAAIYLILAVLAAEAVPRWRTRIYILGCGLAFSTLAGISRIYLGVHYPTDVLAGWAIGSGWAVICWIVARHRRYRRL